MNEVEVFDEFYGEGLYNLPIDVFKEEYSYDVIFSSGILSDTNNDGPFFSEAYGNFSLEYYDVKFIDYMLKEEDYFYSGINNIEYDFDKIESQNKNATIIKNIDYVKNIDSTISTNKYIKKYFNSSHLNQYPDEIKMEIIYGLTKFAELILTDYLRGDKDGTN